MMSLVSLSWERSTVVSETGIVISKDLVRALSPDCIAVNCINSMSHTLTQPRTA